MYYIKPSHAASFESWSLHNLDNFLFFSYKISVFLLYLLFFVIFQSSLLLKIDPSSSYPTVHLLELSASNSSDLYRSASVWKSLKINKLITQLVTYVSFASPFGHIFLIPLRSKSANDRSEYFGVSHVVFTLHHLGISHYLSLSNRHISESFCRPRTGRYICIRSLVSLCI